MRSIIKKFTKVDWLLIISLELLVLLITVVLFFWTKHLGQDYTDTTDIQNQYYPIIDNFRNLFYQTGQLIPQFIPNLGGGQNAFNFAYYVIANPLAICSYLLPFLSIQTYIKMLMLTIVLVIV
ncbi:MAG: hypothetical protein LBT99_01875, partial [Bifidobacteriaceae bacterium]|nr:hypothetical protein [Bifidobacteriaceae bacterium]